MDGILNLFKSTGISSARALHRVRRLLSQRKSGHAGTLDPLAEGVLLICVGRGTKLVEALMDQPKVYRATAALDVTSVSFDRETPPIAVPVPQPPDLQRVTEVLHSFEGLSEQVPPATSAVKIAGRPAYKLHRAGQTPRLTPRPMQIYWLHVHAYEWPLLDFELACGRGTYVRALIRDIGVRLGTGGCLTALTRRAVGPFRIEESWPLERLAATADHTQAIVPLERARAWLAMRPIAIPPRPGPQSEPPQ
jgi:tRNA pseudouridine55 synthase